MEIFVGTTLAELQLETDGFVVDHNFRCPVCLEKPAVYHNPTGHFEPCWDCRKQNWYLIQIKSPVLRWLLRL